MTTRFEIRDGKVVIPTEMTNEEIDALEAFLTVRPDMRPERFDFEAEWSTFERRIARWADAQRRKLDREELTDAR